MRIKRNEKINNIPLVKIRDYFKKIRGIGISKMHIRNHFNLNADEINSLIKELLQNDFVEKSHDNEKNIN
ncbi:MAG: hypothetical protein LBL65_02540 [Campylobacteraceae bacterium]|jgi:predicted transcriptional regulator|nr:hypothetical protein [Campylobacteraceae bacterium]